MSREQASGSGKSTLLALLAGERRASAGACVVEAASRVRSYEPGVPLYGETASDLGDGAASAEL